MSKNSFVLRMSYADIFDEMSDKQAGALIKAIFNYIAKGEDLAGLNDVELKMAFKFIKQDLDYDSQKYADLCKARADAVNKRWQKPSIQKHTKNTSVYNPIHNVVDVVSDVVVDSDVDTTNTAGKAAGEAKLPQVKPKKRRDLNTLQVFSNSVIEEFEELESKEQKAVWFKRNCRCLSDILKFCGGNIQLGLGCIRACVERLEKAGLKGGYEAVCRNLPDYYESARRTIAAEKEGFPGEDNEI